MASILVEIVVPTAEAVSDPAVRRVGQNSCGAAGFRGACGTGLSLATIAEIR